MSATAAEQPVRVFLSYGRDREALVTRIAADLRAAGYAPWMDKHEIKPPDAWRQSILDGLRQTRWTFAFLSAHAMREDGPCRDEIAIAMHTRGGAITPILVDDPAVATPPARIGDFQWIDKRHWASVEAAGNPFESDDYQDLLRQILDRLRDPANLEFTHDIGMLADWLDPVEQAADIPPLIDRFAGRLWLRDIIDARRKSQLASRLIWLTGGPGTGKSAFSAWLAHYRHANVTGLNLCTFNSEARRDPARVLRTLAFRLAVRLPDYRASLLELQASQKANNRTLPGNADDLFDLLLAHRLTIDGGRAADRFLLVIDGLDETIRDGNSELAGLLARKARHLPDWLALVVTCRPHTPLDEILSGHAPLRLDDAIAGHLDDLRVYARGWLLTPDRTPAEADALVTRVVAAAQGAFLYLRMLHDAVVAGWMTLDEPAGLPRGLRGIYLRWFHQDFPNLDKYQRRFRPLLGILAAAEGPVPIDLLARILGWSPMEQGLILHDLGSLFPASRERVTPFHQSLRDWLTGRLPDADREAPPLRHPYLVDADAGSRALADVLWNQLVVTLDVPSHPEPDYFMLAELPIQLGRHDRAFRQEKAAATGGWDALATKLQREFYHHRDNYHWPNARAWITLLVALAALFDDPASQSRALSVLGDLFFTTGETSPAIEMFRAGMQIGEHLARQDQGNARWQRDLSISHNKIGDVLTAQGDLPGALAAFRAGMEISEHLARQDQGNAEWQRDLSVSHERIGDVLTAQGDLPGALAAFRAGMEIREHLARQDQGNTEWQRDLFVSHERIGNGLTEQGDLPGALAAFRAGMEISERLARQDQGNAQWQRDLSISHDRIGDVLTAQGDLPGALVAFRAGMEIRQRLARQDQGNAQWQRDLSVSHERIGDVLTAQGDLPGALAAFRASMEIRQRLVRQDQGNAQWQRDLSVSHNKIGDVLTEQGDLPGALAAFRAGMEIRERLARQDHGNAQWQRDLSISHDRIGDVLTAQGDLPGALAAFRAGMEIHERLARQDQGNAEWQRDLSVSHERIGNVLTAQGDLPGALAAFRASMEIRQRLARQDQGNAQWQRNLAVSHAKLALTRIKTGEIAEARAHLGAGRAIIADLVARYPDWVQWRRDLERFEALLGSLPA